MFHGSWAHEARHPKKWIFHPRKRSVFPHLLTAAAALLLVYVALSRF